MKFIIVLFSLFLIVGCNSGGGSSSTSPPVLDGDGGSTPVVPVVPPVIPPVIPVVTTKHIVYITNSNDDTISVVSYDESDDTTDVIETKAVGDYPTNLTVHSTGKWLYVTNVYDDNVGVYSINQTTGALTFIENIATGDGPSGIAISDDGDNLYITNQFDDNLFVYSINTTTGALTYQEQKSIGSSPMGVLTIDDYVYATNYASGFLHCFSRDGSGLLTLIETEAVANNMYSMLTSTDKKFMYTTNLNDNSISRFAIEADGALTFEAATVVGAGITNAVIYQDYMYDLEYSNNEMQSHDINSVNGVLAAKENISIGTGPHDIQLLNDLPVLIVTYSISDIIDLYKIEADGTITTISLSIPTGDYPSNIASVKLVY